MNNNDLAIFKEHWESALLDIRNGCDATDSSIDEMIKYHLIIEKFATVSTPEDMVKYLEIGVASALEDTTPEVDVLEILTKANSI